MEVITYFRIRNGQWLIIPTLLICWRGGVFQFEPSWMNFGVGVMIHDKQ